MWSKSYVFVAKFSFKICQSTRSLVSLSEITDYRPTDRQARLRFCNGNCCFYWIWKEGTVSKFSSTYVKRGRRSYGKGFVLNTWRTRNRQRLSHVKSLQKPGTFYLPTRHLTYGPPLSEMKWLWGQKSSNKTSLPQDTLALLV